MAHLELEKVKNVSAFRNIAIGTWRTAYDPSVYGTMEVEMDRAMAYLERFRAATGLRLTISHMMARVVAAAFEEIPDANAILRFGRVYRRKRVGVFFQVGMTDEDDEIDLSGATLFDVDKKSLVEIVEEFQAKVDQVRKHQDPALEKSRQAFKRIPGWAMHHFLRTLSFFLYTLNRRLPGTPEDPFGSIMVTNIGSLGLDMAYVPLVPYSRVPMLLAIGAVKERARVEDGELVIKKIMKVNATFDHRFIDGLHAAQMSKVIHRWFGEPERYFGPIPGEDKAEVELSAVDPPKVVASA